MTDREKLFNLLDSAIAESKKSCKEQGDCESCRYMKFGAKCQEMAQVDYLFANGVVPVVHGYWVDHYICSNCGNRSTCGLDADVWTSYEPPFCPNCGARMDGDGNA